MKNISWKIAQLEEWQKESTDACTLHALLQQEILQEATQKNNLIIVEYEDGSREFLTFTNLKGGTCSCCADFLNEKICKQYAVLPAKDIDSLIRANSGVDVPDPE